MRVRYTPRARGDIEKIWHYLNERNPTGAANVVKAFTLVSNLLQTIPKHHSERMIPRYA